MSIFASLSSFNVEKFEENSTKKFDNAIFSNGLWQKRKEPVGEFVIQVEKFDGTKYGLTTPCQLSYTPALPKIPYGILLEVIKFFREVQVKFSSEVYIGIYWDKTKQDYFIHVPKQKVSGAAVIFENDESMLNNLDYVIVCDIH